MRNDGKPSPIARACRKRPCFKAVVDTVERVNEVWWSLPERSVAPAKVLERIDTHVKADDRRSLARARSEAIRPNVPRLVPSPRANSLGVNLNSFEGDIRQCSSELKDQATPKTLSRLKAPKMIIQFAEHLSRFRGKPFLYQKRAKRAFRQPLSGCFSDE